MGDIGPVQVIICGTNLIALFGVYAVLTLYGRRRK